MWCLGGILCVAMTVFALRKMSWKKTFSVSVNWHWLKKGFLGSMPFFGSTVAMLGVQYADRFFIQNYHGEAMVGVYTFYANIANVVQTFVFTGVIAILYPKIIDAFQKRKYDEYNALMRKMSAGVIGGVVVLSGIAAVAIVPLLKLVNKSIYNEYLSVFWILLAAISVLVLCSIPHYGLFVRHRDRQIFISTLVAVVCTITLNFVLVPQYGVQGAAISCLVGYVVLFLLKTNFLLSGKRFMVKVSDDERVGVKL
jgi:O-antigen/teichoic acid export membrane protein